jgi:hypothetical protein
MRDRFLFDIDDNLLAWEVPHAIYFPTLARRISKATKIDYQTIVDNIRKVNTAHGTIEYSALIQEMPCLQSLKPQKIRELIQLATSTKKEVLTEFQQPFPFVEILLETIRINQKLLVALSDAPVNMAYLRLKKADLLKYFSLLIGRESPPDKLFAPEHQMGNKPYDIPVLTSNEIKPGTDLEGLLQMTTAEISEKFYMVGNSSFSDEGIARKYGIPFYKTNFDKTTKGNRATLAKFAPPAPNQSDFQFRPPEHSDFSITKVNSPLDIIVDLKEKGILSVSSEYIEALSSTKH